MPARVTSILWRRLDAPGHDACRLERVPDGWRLAGVAAFRHEHGPASIAYELVTDERWITRSGSASGWVGDVRVDVRVHRSESGAWTLGDERVAAVDGCAHLDFGFTPATNLPQLRALDLRVGAHAQCPVAWIDVPECSLERIEQRYERVAAQRYAYESPKFGYAAVLAMDPDGFVREYPSLWQSV